MKKYAVLDLGTNSFHLLIVTAKPNGQFEPLYEEEIFVKLAENGIETIGQAPYQRGINVLKKYHQVLQQHQVKSIRASGTAALRTATNGPQFIKDVKKETGISIEVISGIEEAHFIHLGVMQTVSISDKNALIVDIGGGSVEFIIANSTTLFWAQSFPIGAAVLYRNFQHSEPISAFDLQRLDQYLDSELHPLFQAIQTYPVAILIGASGTFEVIKKFLVEPSENSLSCPISINQFNEFYQSFLSLNFNERLTIKQLENARAEYIVVALFLIDFLLKRTEIKQLISSAYALKEGILQKMIQKT